jgi:hypothetical protein
MKKLTLTMSAATALAAATIGLAAPAAASPSVYHQDDPCTVHVNHQGSDVDVKWC